MERIVRRYGYLLGLILLLGAGGCANVLATAMYVVRGTNVPPEYEGMKGKKVAVVCRALVGLKYQDSRVAKDLAHEVGRLLKTNGSKIEVIDARKVDKWTDENSWDDYGEVGKAVNADLVLGIDMEHFELYQGQTLYQGRSNLTVHLYDCKKENDVVFEKTLPQCVYPPNTCVQTSEKQESQFRREFIQVLADQIGRYFYEHDPNADLGLDTAAL